MIFVNSRRLAERLAAALNETGGRGDRARAPRLGRAGAAAEIEDRLKRGELPAIVATSSLELGHRHGRGRPGHPDRGAAVGRVGHSADRPRGPLGRARSSRGVIFPKYRGDLLACAAATARMLAGEVEETFYPAQPARRAGAADRRDRVSMDAIDVDDLYAIVRRAAPFAELPRASFEGVLDMLSGRYPSDEFAELRPRLTWDRVGGSSARARAPADRGRQRGTIPDRGLYGVFLGRGRGQGSRRVGELDEEMVFESHAGDVFLLGASSWRIEEITHDRVIVTPAPGEPGKMPFWHGDGAGPAAGIRAGDWGAGGQSAGAAAPRGRGETEREHGSTERAAGTCSIPGRAGGATGEVPSDRRSSWSDSSTRSATGALRLLRRSARACTLRGRRPFDTPSSRSTTACTSRSRPAASGS